jgi:hypothetical protein
VLYPVDAVLGVNSCSRHAMKQRDDNTWCSAMMIQLCTRRRESGVQDENDEEDMSRREKFAV